MSFYAYHLARRQCLLCDKWHDLALESFKWGALHADSPVLTLCYACQLASMDPDARIAAKVRFRRIWQQATDQPIPPELAL